MVGCRWGLPAVLCWRLVSRWGWFWGVVWLRGDGLGEGGRAPGLPSRAR